MAVRVPVVGRAGLEAEGLNGCGTDRIVEPQGDPTWALGHGEIALGTLSALLTICGV